MEVFSLMTTDMVLTEPEPMSIAVARRPYVKRLQFTLTLLLGHLSSESCLSPTDELLRF
jgi:hypothetical protein